MLFTILFIILFVVRNNKKDILNKKNDNEIEIIELDNSLNHCNPAYYDDYWNKIYKELLVYSLNAIGVLVCICLDILYINYMYLQD